MGGITGADTSLVCTCSNSGASLGISMSGQDTSCQRLVTSNMVNQVRSVKPMLFNQVHDSGFSKAEPCDVCLEFFVCVFVENRRGNCVGKENSNPADDFNKSMPTTNLNVETVELLVSCLFSLCRITFVKRLSAKKGSEDIGQAIVHIVV